MSSDGIGGVGDKQAFGAQVVTATLDAMNGVNTAQSMAPVDKQSFGAAVVTTTLDYMNSGSLGGGLGAGASSDYDFQKKVLEGGLAAKGLVVDNKI